MDFDRSPGHAVTRGRLGRIVVRGEFGPLLTAALPECEIAVLSGGDARVSDGASPIFVEISHTWPPNEANVLEPATWRLELLLCGDNIRPERWFVTPSFDGTWPQPESAAIWGHFVVQGPFPEISQTRKLRLASTERGAEA